MSGTNTVNAASVDGVLLADGWHSVWDASFTVKPGCISKWGPHPDTVEFSELFDSSGLVFSFLTVENDDEVSVLSGPLSSVLATRTRLDDLDAEGTAS